jgi:acyl-CoA thioester hydrolase
MPERPQRADFAFFHHLRVRWAEVDAQGIVFNPHYLMFADVGWTEYMRAAGFAYPQGLSDFDVDLFAAHAELDFFASARYDDELDVGVRTREIGRTSLRMQVGIFRGDAPLCNIGLVYVVASKQTLAPVAVPAAFADGLAKCERVPPLRKQP